MSSDRIFRLRRYNIQSLPKAIRRQLAPDPGCMEPSLPSRTKLIRVRVDKACLWSACKSTSLAMILIFIGATMAVIGFYAPELSSFQKTVGNITMTLRDSSTYWHLKNLTYVGPAFMGLGCVIIVAICVMTFEARDKAAKICPQDPEKAVNDVLYVNVIKSFVRKYSGTPKVNVMKPDNTDEETKLITPSSFRKEKHSSHFLEKPDTFHARSSSEPCFVMSNLIDLGTQYPVLGGSASQSATPNLVRAISTAFSLPLPIEPPSNQLQNSLTKFTVTDQSPPLSRSAAGGEVVNVDIHPLPTACLQFPTQYEISSPCPDQERGGNLE